MIRLGKVIIIGAIIFCRDVSIRAQVSRKIIGLRIYTVNNSDHLKVTVTSKITKQTSNCNLVEGFVAIRSSTLTLFLQIFLS